MIADLSEKFLSHLNTSGLLGVEQKILIAFSGGLDSTALLVLMALHFPQKKLAAAHLHHGFRGEAADADQEFAGRLTESLGLKFITSRLDVPALARIRGQGPEEAARKARYQFLSEAALDWGASLVLTAHQADDQVETVLLHLVRGTGAGGLAGIHPRRPLSPGVEVIRPLLPFSRAELQTWLEARDQRWCEDLSNQDLSHPRNALRQDIIPALRNLNPGLLKAVGRTTEILRAEEDFWSQCLRDLEAVVVLEKNQNFITLDRQALADLTLAEKRRLLYQILLQVQRNRPRPGNPLSLATVDMVLNLLEVTPPCGLDLPGGLRGEVDRKLLRLSLASRFKPSML